jgi:hypothetical protein
MSLLAWLRRLLSSELLPPRPGDPLAAAVEANARGNEAAEQSDPDEAVRCYHEAARLDPRWAVPWFNLGIEHKLAGRWRESLDASARALALDPEKKPAAWNLGIAATALGEWAEARRAWREYGLEVPPGDGPPEMNLGPVALRVGGESALEVVWGVRLDPARARIATVPMRESGRCLGDVVLHDGEPRGHRMLGHREVPVFEELELLAPSRESTWVVKVTVPARKDLDALLAELERRGVPAEDWTTTVRILCRACDEGNPDLPAERHDERCGRRPGGDAWDTGHILAAAAERDDALREALAEWAEGGTGRAHGEPELALDAAARVS